MQAAIVVAAFGPGGDVPGDMDGVVTLGLLSRGPIMFPVSGVVMQNRMGALERAVDGAVDHG